MKAAAKAIWHAMAVLGTVTLVAGLWFRSQGISTREAPGPVEIDAARALRHYMIPSAERARQNPQPATKETIRAGLEHFADHCASCHANDGSGETALGQGLYPRAPDMRQDSTQQLSDGALFHIVEHGVKLTGMPGLGNGSPESEEASWHLVHFIRHLPSLTAEELAEMAELNPRSAVDWRALEEERRFLSGEGPVPAPPSSGQHHPQGGHQ